MPTTSHNMKFKKNIVPWWCLHHITHYKKKLYCIWWCLLMLEINILFNLSMKDCMFVTSTTVHSKGCLDLIVIGYSWAWGGLIIAVGHPHPLHTSFHFIGSSFKFKPEWISLPHAKCINSTMLYSTSTISSLANCTYTSIGTSLLPRFKEEIKLVNSFVVSFILGFTRSWSMA